MKLIGLLKDFGLKATPQRVCILKILQKHEHPNMDKLYKEVKDKYPSISLATVYKNLNTMIECGLVVEVNIPNHKTSYYDIYEDPHIHIVCSRCSHIQDLDFKESKIYDYQDKLEKNIKRVISYIDCCVYIENCHMCDSQNN